MSSVSRPWLTHPVEARHLHGDSVRADDALFGLVWVNPNRMSGTPCFFGTRVPVQTLFDYLEEGQPLGEFLEDFPGVTGEHAARVLHAAGQQIQSRGLAA